MHVQRQNYSFLSDVGAYLVTFKQKLSHFFRNRKGKLISERELIFEDHPHIYPLALAFPVNLRVSIHSSGKFLEINQFYLRSSFQSFWNWEGGTKNCKTDTSGTLFAYNF